MYKRQTTNSIAKLAIVNGGTGDTVYSYCTNASNTGAAFSVYRASTSGYSMYFNVNSNQAGTITHPTQTTTTYGSGSDYRLKENIEPLNNALNTVLLLKPSKWVWKIDGTPDSGFVAHELQEYFPNAVTGKKDQVDENGKPIYQCVDTSFLVATLTAAIQEQQAIITTLQTQVAALQAKVGA